MKVQQVADIASASLGVESSLLTVRWVSDRYLEWATSKRLKPFRRLFELVVPAKLDTGTATATKGSKTIIGNAAAQAVWSRDIVGRHVRLKNNWHEIVDFNETSSDITIAADFAEDTVTAGSYNIIARQIKLDPEVRWPGTFVNMNVGIALDNVSFSMLDIAAPRRASFQASPSAWTLLKTDEEGVHVIEFYPYPVDDALIGYTGYIEPKELKADDTLPPHIQPQLLIEGVKASIMQKRMADAIDAGNNEGGATWRNDYRAQETVWKNMKQQATKEAEVVNDTSFILEMFFNHHTSRDFGEIKTARDHILSGWTPLS